MREVLDQVRTFSRTVVGKERLVESVIKEVRGFLRLSCAPSWKGIVDD